MSVRDAIEREKLYFATHPVYSIMPPGLLGTDILTSKLTRVLFTHIKHNLPEITKEIREKVRDIEDRLKDLGPSLPADGPERMHLLWNMITDFITIYKNTITGRFDSKRYNNSQNTGKKELSGGAKIKLHFYGLYKNFLNFNATQEYSDSDIEKAIMLHEGDTIPGFPSVDVFIYLIQPQLEKLREPALDLLQDVYHMLEQMAQSIVERIFQRFPSLIPELMDIITTVLQTERDKCRDLVEAVIDAEQNYLFTNDQDYLMNRTDIVPTASPDNQPGPGQSQQNNGGMQNVFKGKQQSSNLFVREIRARIDAYFKIVLRNIRDSVPKVVGYFLVKSSQDRLQFELYAQINKNEVLTKQLGEPERVAEERKQLNATLETLKKAIKVLQRDPDITSTAFGEDELEAELKVESMNRHREQANQRQRPPSSNGNMDGGQSWNQNQMQPPQRDMNSSGMGNRMPPSPNPMGGQGNPMPGRGGPGGPGMQGGMPPGQMNK